MKVHLDVDWQPERYQLSSGLASLLGLELETRHRVIEVLTHQSLRKLGPPSLSLLSPLSSARKKASCKFGTLFKGRRQVLLFNWQGRAPLLFPSLEILS